MRNHRLTYVALVAALRNEFNDLQREALWTRMREHRYGTSSLGVLAQAVHDAQDLAYEIKTNSGICCEGWTGPNGERVRCVPCPVTDQAASDTRPYAGAAEREHVGLCGQGPAEPCFEDDFTDACSCWCHRREQSSTDTGS